MHCVGTQTRSDELLSQQNEYESSAASCRSYCIPRRSKSPAVGKSKSVTPSPRHSPSPRHLQAELPERTPRSRKSSVSKSSKSLNVYEEIRHHSSSNIDGIYAKINERETLSSTPVTPKYSRKIEKRSSSLPRRKTSRLEPVTHTDFPYDEKYKEEAPIRPEVLSRRSSSFENLLPFSIPQPKNHEKIEHAQDMTSLTSSGYDTQTNSIISTNEIPYSLKISNNYLTSSSPPASLTIIEDEPSANATLSLTSNVSVESNGKGSVSVEVTGPSESTRQKLERFPSLYSPRELLKSGYGFEPVEFTPAHSEDDLDKLCDMFPKIELQKNLSKIPVKKLMMKRPLAVDNNVMITTKVGKEFPSLTDLTVNFKSLAAQNILNSVNTVSTSVDTLVQVNNRDDKTFVNVSTDFGIV